MGRHYAYAELTDAEWAVVCKRARREGLTMSNYVRRCINAVALQEGDESMLLEERCSGRRSTAPLANSTRLNGRRV